jgi:HEAT repeat protein
MTFHAIRRYPVCLASASRLAALLVLSVSLAAPAASSSSPGATDSAGKQQPLIALIQSSAPPANKAIACKRLAVYGTEAAVPALAALLPDAQLSSWARIALEVIPGPAADDALRQAAGALQGRLLVGVINSIGVRRDAKAVALVAAKLADSDAEVASAAAETLGRIGGKPAAKALKPLLAKAPAGVRSAVAEGCIRCAEQYLAQGKHSDAIALYDAVCKADVPRLRILEATRGAILARQDAGLPLLLAELRSADKARWGLGLRVARELPGPKAAKALTTELWRAVPERQPFLLLALADRGEAEALPVALDAAKRGAQPLRLTAIGVLERIGGSRVVPALLDLAGGADTESSTAAVAALVRLPGNEIEAEILSCLEPAKGKLCQALIEIANQRRLDAALPAITRRMGDPDDAIRGASLRAVGNLGGDEQIGGLIQLLGQPLGMKDRTAIEAALLTISGRQGQACVARLQSLARNGDSATRTIALHALAAAGGPQALATLKAGTEDTDESVRDEAVRVLSSWPNTWPEDGAVMEPLMALARNDGKASHKVLALRGCLQFLQNDKQLKPDQKPAKVAELLPLLSRPEEKRLAIAVIRDALNAPALELLTAFASDSAVADDASSAILDIVAKGAAGIPKEPRQKALQAIAAHSTNEAFRNSAADALRKLN